MYSRYLVGFFLDLHFVSPAFHLLISLRGCRRKIWVFSIFSFLVGWEKEGWWNGGQLGWGVDCLTFSGLTELNVFPVLVNFFPPSVQWQVLWKRVKYAMKPCESWGWSSVRSTQQESWTASHYTCKNVAFKVHWPSPQHCHHLKMSLCVWRRARRYGVVLRKLDLLKEAVEVFVEAIHALPLHWGAWLELSNLVTNGEMVSTSCVYMYTTLDGSAAHSMHPESKLRFRSCRLENMSQVHFCAGTAVRRIAVGPVGRVNCFSVSLPRFSSHCQDPRGTVRTDVGPSFLMFHLTPRLSPASC